MRVISGLYRGRKILSPRHEGVRPTTDRVKENIFNIISPYIDDSVVLDLFGGTGAISIEFLSRGAKTVYTVDSDRNSYRLILQNCDGLDPKPIVSNSDYNIALLNYKNKGIKFDIVFLDPPYASKFAEFAINKIKEFDLLSEDGIIVWENLKELNKLDNYKPPYEIYDNRIYGEIQVTFLRAQK